tara:strand:+ start:1935 stop:2453 length:519 start_codon:yes stop_codon:yes gene_type:complete
MLDHAALNQYVAPIYSTSAYQVRERANVAPRWATPSTSAGAEIIVFVTHTQASKTATIRIRDYSPEYKAVITKLPWASEFFKTSSQLNSVKTLLPYYKEINKLIAHKNFKDCDDFLRQIRVSDISDVLLVGLLRLTNNWSQELPAWHGLLDRSKKEITSRGHDSKVLLKGLV